MTYLDEIDTELTIPRHTFGESTGYILELSSNMSDSIVFNVNNVSSNSLYYTFNLNDTERLNVGEYNYTLKDSNLRVLETGLITFGNYERTVTANDTTNYNKIQYNG